MLSNFVMSKISIIFTAFLAFFIIQTVSAQKTVDKKRTIPLGIVNGKAKYLPTPDYPQEAKDFCADGKVEVKVLIGENGNVISAKAISGDDLLRDSAVEAAKKAVFGQTPDLPPTKIKGIVVYNFDPLARCINVGIVNKKALSIPKPQIANLNQPKHLQIKEDQSVVVVEIVIDENGKVTNAKAISGHPLLRGACEISARQAKFLPNSPPVKIKALLIYKFKLDGTIDTDIEKNDKEVIGTPVNLVKPSSVSCNCGFGENPHVLVEAEIDKIGNVISAKAISGHPILKSISEKAALYSKFIPTNNKAKITIKYNFESTGKWYAKFINIEIVQVENKE